MSTTPLWSVSATELQGQLHRGETTSEAIVTAHLARIEEIDGKLHAFTEVLKIEALAAAKVSDRERKEGRVRGPLHGLPVSVKECLSMKDHASTIGVMTRTSHRAEEDAALITLLRESGAIITGRTNLSQCMIYAECSNPVFGTTNNPFAKDRTPGGSSGGESAAIAAGMSCLGIGTDIGGSIRIPAAYCGIFGFMPTLDRWPLLGSVAGIPGQESVRGVAGPMARHADDLSLLLHAFDPKRMSQLDPRTPDAAWEKPRDVRGLTIGVLEHDGNIDPSPALARALNEAKEALIRAGATIVPFSTKLLEEAAYLYLAVMSADGGRTMMRVCEGSPLDGPLQGLVRIAKIPGPVRRAIASGLAVSGEARASRVLGTLGEKSVSDLWKLHVSMRAVRQKLLAEWDRAGIDALLCPPGATPALTHGGSKDFLLAMTYTYAWNLMHFPAGVAPVTLVRASEETGRNVNDRFDKKAAAIDLGSAGLPASVQVVARPYHDAIVLGALSALDRELRPREGFPQTPAMYT